MTQTPFGARLEQELLRVGATQQSFARQVGVSQQTVSKWITGETTPRLRHLPNIEALLGVTAGALSSLLFEPRPSTPPERTTKRNPASVAALQRKLGSLTTSELSAVDLYIDELFHNRR